MPVKNGTMRESFREVRRRLRESVSFEELAARYGLELRRTGRTLSCRCPFHPDTHPSFHIYPDGGAMCFGCAWSGDVVAFVAEMERVSIREAMEMLLGDEITARAPVQRAAVAPEERTPTPEERLAVETAHAFYRQHVASPRCQEYLARRGIGLETARLLGMGWGAPGLLSRLTALGLQEAALQLGLLRRTREGRLWEPFRSRVIIADLDREGKARWLTGRAADDTTQPKYLNISLPKPILGLEMVEGDETAVVEGPLDWAAAWAMGIPAVATLGAQVSRLRLSALGRFRRLYLLLDADDAGRQAARELRRELGERAEIVPLPRGAKDVADVLLLPGGLERLQETLVQRGMALSP